MNRVAEGVAHLAAALAIGAGAGAGAVALLVDHRDDAIAAERRAESTDLERTAPLGDRLTEALDALRDDGVYVAPDGRDLLDAEGERAVERAVAANPVPVYVVVWAPDAETGRDPRATQQALVRELGDRDGVLLVWEGPQQGAVEVVGPSGGFVSTYSSYLDFVGDPAVVLPDAVASIHPETFYDDSDVVESDYWGGVGGGATLGTFLGAGVVGLAVGLAKILALVRGRRRLLPGRWGWGTGPATAPTDEREVARR